MRVLKTKWLVRFSRRERISDRSLIDAISRAERGLVDADLGDGLIKQRVARTGQGRSGGYRMLVAYRSGSRAVFLYGFAKNELENIGDNALLTLREVALGWLAANEPQIAQALDDNVLQEVKNEPETPDQPTGRSAD